MVYIVFFFAFLLMTLAAASNMQPGDVETAPAGPAAGEPATPTHGRAYALAALSLAGAVSLVGLYLRA